ncbi:CoA transferase [Nocardia sp. NPDC004604]|uniref:CoA transferase n=1 Tax=Nocardia sp. NPDC004604 TaxID=3157013 RepID=UPI0033A9A33E
MVLSDNSSCAASGLRASGDLVVVSMVGGLTAALVAKHFAELGASVSAVIPPACDPAIRDVPARSYWDSLVQPLEAAEVDAALAGADVCIVGRGSGGFDLARISELAARHPRLVVLDIEADALSVGNEDPVELLAQVRAGLTFQQFAGRPYVHGHRPAAFGTALTALIGGWAALIERQRSGRGQVVSTGPTQGIAALYGALWLSGIGTDSDLRVYPPLDVKQLIFRTRDDRFIQLVLGVPGARATLYRILGLPVDGVDSDRGVPAGRSDDPSCFFADYHVIAPQVARMTCDELLALCWAHGLGAEAVLAPGECWDDPQVAVLDAVVEHDTARYVGRPATFVNWDTGAGPGHRRPVPEGSGPLAGIRVADFGLFVAGPLAARILGDLGADVVHVESPQPATSVTSPRQLLVVNRGKRSMVLDLKTVDGASAARRLVATSDVVIHNYRVGVAERLGLGMPEVFAARPGAVAVQISGFGAAGPKATHTGFDMVVQALTGIERRAGGPVGEPVWVRSVTVDYAAGLVGAIAALVGLHDQAVTGGAIEARMDLLRSALFLTSDVRRDADGSIHTLPELLADLSGFHPADCIYRTLDGWMAVSAPEEPMAQRFASAVGVLAGRRDTWGPDVHQRLAGQIALMTTDELTSVLESSNVRHLPCHPDSWDELVTTLRLCGSDLVVEVDDEHEGVLTGWFGALARFSRSDSLRAPHRSAPRQGQHTAELLRELGDGRPGSRIADLCGAAAPGPSPLTHARKVGE